MWILALLKNGSLRTLAINIPSSHPHFASVELGIFLHLILVLPEKKILGKIPQKFLGDKTFFLKSGAAYEESFMTAKNAL